MPRITFITHDGQQREVVAEVGQSLMHAALDNMVPGIIGECGGACSCATCHTYIEQDFFDQLGAPSGMEGGLLGCVLDLQPNSRLSCQIKITPQLDGLVVRLPEHQA